MVEPDPLIQSIFTSMALQEWKKVEEREKNNHNLQWHCSYSSATHFFLSSLPLYILQGEWYVIGFYCIFLGGARESKFFIDQGRKRIGSSTAMQNSSSYDLSFKILLIGDSGVGKSSLLLSFISNAVDDVTPTIGIFIFILQQLYY